MYVGIEPEVVEVLKWVGIVFAAGFVGYFGRYLSKIVIAKAHKPKTGTASVTQTDKQVSSGQTDELEKARLKLEKKKLKLEKKRTKGVDKAEKESGQTRIE